MEIVTRGTKDLAICGHCGSELRWTMLDVHLKHVPLTRGYGDYDELEPEDDYQGALTCPVCKHSIPVRLTGAQKRNLIESEKRAYHDL